MESDPIFFFSPEDPDTAFNACVMAQRFVTERLKAPSTAEFSDCVRTDDVPVATRDKYGWWTAVGYADAQNSFGAKIRSAYTVTLRIWPLDHKWHANSVDIL